MTIEGVFKPHHGIVKGYYIKAGPYACEQDIWEPGVNVVAGIFAGISGITVDFKIDVNRYAPELLKGKGIKSVNIGEDTFFQGCFIYQKISPF